MSIRKIKDAKDLSDGSLIYFKGHAKATYMSDGTTVEDAINNIEVGGSGSGIYPIINPEYGSWYDLQPNTFYNLGEHNDSQGFTIQFIPPENPDIVNEYIFQFSTGESTPYISFLEPLRWANNKYLELLPNTIYQISIVNNIATYIATVNKLDNLGILEDTVFMYASVYFQYPVASDVEVTVLCDDGEEYSEIVWTGQTGADIGIFSQAKVKEIISVTPASDDMYNYIVTLQK